jgi:xanthine dehydrogenase YagR molybdenum-binding subunit
VQQRGGCESGSEPFVRQHAGSEASGHADVVDIQAHWIDKFDSCFGPTGGKGTGLLGIVGVPAAIGNANHNATGCGLRSLPFTPDMLIV